MTVSFAAGKGTHVYDGTEWTPANTDITVQYDGKNVPFEAEFPEQAKDVRSNYPITIKLTGNYAGTVKKNAGAYSITVATLTVKAKDQTITYGESIKTDASQYAYGWR